MTIQNYVCASIPAWREQARHAIAHGQNESDFIVHCHPDNRSNARTAYQMERAATKPICYGSDNPVGAALRWARKHGETRKQQADSLQFLIDSGMIGPRDMKHVHKAMHLLIA